MVSERELRLSELKERALDRQSRHAVRHLTDAIIAVYEGREHGPLTALESTMERCDLLCYLAEET